MRLLLVEDDSKIAEFVSRGLQQAGFEVDQSPDGLSGLEKARSGEYGVAIVDLMLPELDGLTLIEKLRGSGVQTPVLVLSAKRSVDDRVKGLETGCDDYLTKPFAFSELLARVNALLRRSSDEPPRLQIADLTVDRVRRKVDRSGTDIDLPPREFAVLEYLVRNAGRVVSKAELLEHVWNYKFDPQTNVVDVLVCRLRNKVDRGFQPPLIQTMRGVGYVVQAH
jgi:DNA-binding response OmpR family regulator